MYILVIVIYLNDSYHIIQIYSYQPFISSLDYILYFETLLRDPHTQNQYKHVYVYLKEAIKRKYNYEQRSKPCQITAIKKIWHVS